MTCQGHERGLWWVERWKWWVRVLTSILHKRPGETKLNLDSFYRSNDNLKHRSPYQSKYLSPPQGAPAGPDQAQGLNCITEASGSLLAQHQERKGEGRQRWRRHGMQRGSLPQCPPLSLSLFLLKVKVKVVLRFSSFWTTRECPEPYLLAFIG